MHINLFISVMHDVKKVKVGMPIPHDPHSYEFINWKVFIKIASSNEEKTTCIRS